MSHPKEKTDMKKIVLAICLVSSMMLKLEAQSSNPVRTTESSRQEKIKVSPEQKAKKDAERAEKKLGLNSDQKSKWEIAALERVRANEPLRTKMEGCTTPADRNAIHEQMKINKTKFTTTVSAMLTPEQKTKYEQMKKDKHKHAGKMRGRHEDTPAGPQQHNAN
ncbi:hypothetical protein CNR22_18090 [Sphingobacteriaceae bacterium]|nr:hypothetical protein CNR22_18090 [Sphingobacteriaceae bacterium]